MVLRLERLPPRTPEVSLERKSSWSAARQELAALLHSQLLPEELQ
jgi:hypothetical protein